MFNVLGSNAINICLIRTKDPKQEAVLGRADDISWISFLIASPVQTTEQVQMHQVRTRAKAGMTITQNYWCHLSRAVAIWKLSSVQSAAPDVWPKHRKHKPTASLEGQLTVLSSHMAWRTFAFRPAQPSPNPYSTLSISWCLTLVKCSCHLLCWRKCPQCLSGLC